MYLYSSLGPELQAFVSLCKSRITVSPANLVICRQMRSQAHLADARPDRCCNKSENKKKILDLRGRHHEEL